MKKFWFPKLAEYLKDKGITKSDLFKAVLKISDKPHARTWANAMNENHGVSETYANKCKKNLLKISGLPGIEMDFPVEVASFEAINE
uniref:Uncharacterized protein n=1 Tax=Candidatus Kentrum sp. DK TaxID=2126562 RepID=A0A450RYN8_9GAMM|nr:MAG: hypothetical protein BECKDK2373B_GA0170837_100745 [Candidatus Kentron sp. DK]VFJ50845.1 MAG: hypothetical protein BECKDK2373C_GA0170839_103018 [Candidatus Kentron sp. DK]